MFDYLIVGAGFTGSIFAERLASVAGKRVLLIDRRPHIGGNAYDGLQKDGILIHHYGPHLFHTNDPEVVRYLSGFTEWLPYEHRVLAEHDGILYPMPINRRTLSMFFGRELHSEEEAHAFLESIRLPVAHVRNSEDVMLDRVGRALYEAFFRGYTIKQWNHDPRQLSAGVCGRIPVRITDDDRYFSDEFQAVPAQGYTAMFERMLSHPNIEVLTNIQAQEVMKTHRFKRLIWTGPIDEYFDHIHGRLPYRSMRFEHELHDTEYAQSAAQINYSDTNVAWTRVCEWKRITGQRHCNTILTREYPATSGEPYYPVPSDETAAMYRRYSAEADKLRHVIFAGRLAEYRYYNMDQVAARALRLALRLAGGAS